MRNRLLAAAALTVVAFASGAFAFLRPGPVRGR